MFFDVWICSYLMVATKSEMKLLLKAVAEGKRKKDFSGVHSVIDMILSHWLVCNECRLCLIKGSCDRKFFVRFKIFFNFYNNLFDLNS